MQCFSTTFPYFSCFSDNPPQDSSPNWKGKIIIAVVVVALGLWIFLTFFGISWWKGNLGYRTSREEGGVAQYGLFSSIKEPNVIIL